MTESLELFKSDLVGLAWKFQVNPSSCGNSEHYSQYLRFIALTDKMSGKGTTHVFIRRRDENDPADIQDAILGFITLRATSYTQTEDTFVRGNPALEIYELAVAHSWERIGVGGRLVKFALSTALELNESSIGVQYITLCADERSVPFYEKFKFGKIEEQGEIPRDGWNVGCVPMFLRLPEIIR